MIRKHPQNIANQSESLRPNALILNCITHQNDKEEDPTISDAQKRQMLHNYIDPNDLGDPYLEIPD